MKKENEKFSNENMKGRDSSGNFQIEELPQENAETLSKWPLKE